MSKRRIPIDKELGQRITIRLDRPSHAQLQEYAASEGFTCPAPGLALSGQSAPV